MKPKLVIFDCDGVLVDSEHATNEVLIERLGIYGFKTDVSQAMHLFVGGTIASVAEKVRSEGVDLPDDWVPVTYEAMFTRLRQGVAIIPGVVEMLDRLDAAGIPFCIGSNGPMSKMEITLGQTGLMPRFRHGIFSAHDVGSAKPAPGLFLHAAKVNGVAPEDTIVIEDSASGAKAAQAAGMRCFGYAVDTPAERLEAVGAIVFKSMYDLPELVGL